MSRVQGTLLLVMAICFLVASATAPARAETCSCDAPDGSCSINITCPGGCIAFCARHGLCNGDCTNHQYKALPIDLDARVSLSLDTASAQDLSSVLTQQVGTRVTFVPYDFVSDEVSLEIHGASLRAVLEHLARFGGIAVSPDASPGYLDAVVSFKLEDAAAPEINRLLTGLLGVEVNFSPSVADEVFNLTAKRVPARTLLDHLRGLGVVWAGGSQIGLGR